MSHSLSKRRLSRALFCLLLSAAVFHTSFHDCFAADGQIARFFRMGDGKISVRNAHNGLQASVRLLNQDGSLNQEGLKAIDKVFGYSSEEKDEHISLRLLFFMDYFSDKTAAGKVLQLQSGYRDPEYNQHLRKMGRNVALTSTHMDAMAADFFIDGVKGKHLWEVVRKEGCCGVGHYGGRSIHLDSGRPRFWEAATSKISSNESEMNRRIYLCTQYDRYRPGEMMYLSLSGISDFGFGVRPDVAILADDGRREEANLVDSGGTALRSVRIDDRKAARSLRVVLPEQIPVGHYRLHIRFYDRPFPQMPAETSSNVVEIVQEQ